MVPMQRMWWSLPVALLVVVSVLPVGAEVPDVDDEIFWYQVADAAGDDHFQCQTLVDGGVPREEDQGGTNESTACDIRSIELGNTDTHLMVRWTLASAGFGVIGSLGYVDYTNVFRGNFGDLEVDRFEIVLRLNNTDDLDVVSTNPTEWQEQIEFGMDGDQIVYAIPLAVVGETMIEGETRAFQDWVNATSATTSYQRIDGVGQSFDGDSLENLGGNETYTFQAFGDLKAPKVDPVVRQQEIEDDGIDVTEAFELGSPSLEDPCRPWNETCFMAAQPVSLRHEYVWDTDWSSVDLLFEAEAAQGTAQLVVQDGDGEEVVAAGDLDADEPASLSIDELLRPVAAGAWSIVVELDRFEGSFTLGTTEGEPLPGGEGNGSNNNGSGSNGNGDGGNQETDSDGNTTGDLDDENGIPGPGALVLVTLVGGLISLRRRRRSA